MNTEMRERRRRGWKNITCEGEKSRTNTSIEKQWRPQCQRGQTRGLVLVMAMAMLVFEWYSRGRGLGETVGGRHTEERERVC